jgi:outer membrane lipoprotein-sorting protein
MTGRIPPHFSTMLVAGLIALAPAASAQTAPPVPPASIPSAQAKPAAAPKSITAAKPKASAQSAKPRKAASTTARPARAAAPAKRASAPKPRTAAAAPAPKPAAPVAAPMPAFAQATNPAARPGNVGQAGRVPIPVAPNTRNVTRPGAAFDGGQRELVAKVSAYLSGIQTLVGNFVQVGPDGSRTTGDFYMQKPGRVRFEYDAPSPISLIADGQSVAVRDRKLATQDVIPLSQTPLRFLLADRIDLMRDAKVVGVHADDVFVTVVIEEKSSFVGTHRLMLMFGAKDLQLRQWTITDPQGFDTTVAVYNLDASKRPDPTLFKIDYTRYQ